jgi:hypothetical protein
MTHLEVKYVKLIDAAGRRREGWSIIENGRPGYPEVSKDAAIIGAQAIAQIRRVSGIVPKVIVTETKD